MKPTLKWLVVIKMNYNTDEEGYEEQTMYILLPEGADTVRDAHSVAEHYGEILSVAVFPITMHDNVMCAFS